MRAAAVNLGGEGPGGLPPPDALLGAFAGSYRIVAVVGAGGMGRVYRAEHPELGRQAAVKVLAQALTGDADLVRRFKVEAQAVARLSHPNIVEVLDYGVLEDGRPFYTMELLRGESLHGFLRRTGRTTVAALVSILDPVLAGLDAAHAAGIVHRDLKPENIFLCARDGGYVPKLLDFGVAKLVEPAGGAGGAGRAPHTQTGSLLGTPMYMSPEQAAGQTTRIGPPSDLYSMGVIAFEMLTGRPPFVAAHLGELIHQHLSAAPPLLRELRPDAPADLEALLAMALAKDPAERPQSAAAMRRALAQIAAPQPVTIVEFGTPGAQAAPASAGLATPPTRIAQGSEPQRAGAALAAAPGSPAQAPPGSPVVPQASTLRTRRVLFPALAVTAALLAGAAIATVLVRGAASPDLTGHAAGALAPDAAAPTVTLLAGAADAGGAGAALAPDAAPAERAPAPAPRTTPVAAAAAPRAGRSPATPPAHERAAQSGTPGGQRPASNLPPGAEGERFERLLKESRQHAANRDHDAQLATAEAALRIAPDDDEANFMAGHAGCMKKDAALAKRHFERIRDRRVRAALEDVCTRFGAVYLTPESRGSPADKSRRALELYPQSVDALIKDPARALALALEIIELQPTFEGAWIMAAGASCRLGKLDDVKKYLKQVPERMYDVVRLSCEAVKLPFPDPRADAGP